MKETAAKVLALDGLRGLAALLVFITHASGAYLHLIPGVNLNGMGKNGVYLFFLLSSFLLTGPFLVDPSKLVRRDSLMNYLWRRFIRVYPLYIVLVTVGFLLNLAYARGVFPFDSLTRLYPLSVKEWINHVLLLQGKGVLWSILVEFRYYLVLPFVAAVFAFVCRNRPIPAVVAGVALVVGSSLMFPPTGTDQGGYGLAEFLPLFIAGSTLAVVVRALPEQGTARWSVPGRVWDWLALAAGVAIVLRIPATWSWVTGQEIPRTYFHKDYALWALLWAAVMMGALAGAGPTRRIFENGALRFMGNISFSFYMLHMPVLILVQRLVGPRPGAGWIAFAATTAVSYASWKLVEMPFLKIQSRRRPVVGVGSADVEIVPGDAAETEQTTRRAA